MKGRLLLIFLLPIVMCGIAWYCWYSPVATVILVRHAERLNSTDTTSLSEAGVKRAEALAHVLSASGVSRIYVSQKLRTHQTAQPTASAFGIMPIEISANEIRLYGDSVKTHRGEVILIVGHSDSVPKIIGRLGIAIPPTIAADEFDNLFVVTMFRFRSTLTHLKY
mgnify:CR=1 FL=1